jgi:hypothetical protein
LRCGDPHQCNVHPFFALNGQPKTFTALAITSVAVVSAAPLCAAIIVFAERVNGIVLVGQNAIRDWLDWERSSDRVG